MDKREQTIELNRYRNVNRADVDAVKKFVSSGKKGSAPTSWAKRFKDKLTVKGSDLLLDGRIVVANEEREDLMRDLVYNTNSDVAPSRDAGYYLIKKRYVNVSRREWLQFLKKQRVIRMTDNAPPKMKRGGRKLSRKGELEQDLFFISKNDVPKHMRIGVKEDYAVLVVVDRLTSLCYVAYTGRKDQKSVSPKIKDALTFFSKRLNMPKNKLVMYSDAGKEFDPKVFKDLGVEFNIVTTGSKVEKKNADIQRQFHRLKNAKRLTSVADGLRQATTIVNNSYNRVIKMSANEAAEKYSSKEETDKLLASYNKQRQKADEDRRRPLKVGDEVRIVMKSTKPNPFYKAYRGKQYTREGYPVNENNKQFYKNAEVTKEHYPVTEVRGSKPTKYRVNGKLYTRDRLSEPLPPIETTVNGKKRIVYEDPKSEQLLKSRGKKPKAKAKASPMEKGSGPSKSTRAGKKKVVQEKMHPKQDATVHAFKDKAEAETEFKRLKNIVKLVLKAKQPAKSKVEKLIKELEVVRNWYHWHGTNGPKFDRYNMRSAKKEVEAQIKKLRAI